MPPMGKTEEDWNGLKLGFLKTVQPNSFMLLASSKMMLSRHICLSRSLILSFTCNFFAYVNFLSGWGRVKFGKINQNELDCHDTTPLTCMTFVSFNLPLHLFFLYFVPPPPPPSWSFLSSVPKLSVLIDWFILSASVCACRFFWYRKYLKLVTTRSG